MLAYGVVFVLLIGEIDLSISYVSGIAGVVVAQFTLAGFQIWQGVIQKSIPQGVLVIQDNTVNNVANYFFSERDGWIIAIVVSAIYVTSTVGGVLSRRRQQKAGR